MAGVDIFSVKGDQLGSEMKIWIDRENRDHTYVVSWRLYKENGRLVTGVIYEEEGGATMVEWTPPLELAAYRPSETSFDLDLRVEEMDDDGMVDYDTYTVTVHVPDNSDTQPQISEITLKPVALGSIYGVFVEQLSQVQAVFAAETVCSQIADYAIQVGSRTVTSDQPVLTTGALAVSGTVTVLCTVTDLRGYAATEELTLEVLPYAPPRTAPAAGQTRVRISRYDQTTNTELQEGASVRIQCSRVYSKVMSEGVQLNYCRLQARTCPAEGGEYGDWETVLSEEEPDDQADVVLTGEYLPTREYLIQIRAQDTAGNSSLITLRLPALGCTLHLAAGGKALGVGQFAPGQEQRVDFGWQVHLNRGVGLQIIWEGTAAGEGDTLSGADGAAAMHYHLYLVTAGGIPLMGVRQDSTLIAAYGKYLMQFTCTEEGISLLTNEFATGPTGVYGIV